MNNIFSIKQKLETRENQLNTYCINLKGQMLIALDLEFLCLFIKKIKNELKIEFRSPIIPHNELPSERTNWHVINLQMDFKYSTFEYSISIIAPEGFNLSQIASLYERENWYCLFRRNFAKKNQNRKLNRA